MTTSELATELAIDPKRLRAWLRSTLPRDAGERAQAWNLDETRIEAARRHFAPDWEAPPTPRPTSVERRSQPARRSSGLHQPVLTLAAIHGLQLELGRPLPWLTGRGHLEPVVIDEAPPAIIDALRQMHRRLGGDERLLAAKRPKPGPVPDLVHTPTGMLIEVDEVQHFSSARAETLEMYPDEVVLGFDLDDYRAQCLCWSASADRSFAHKTSADFPSAGGRTAQRAYNDALRDLLAPVFTDRAVIRLAVPDRNVDGAIEAIIAQLGIR